MVGIDKWFRRRRAEISATPELPELWARCAGCAAQIYKKELGQNLGVCPECGHHHRISVEERITSLTDPDSFTLVSGRVGPVDTLNFVDLKPYPERLKEYQEKCGRPDAIVVGTAQILSRRVVLGVLDYDFMGGSMGSVVGEEVCRAVDQALAHRLPFVMVCASGGARMQEGTLSLMQM
ncbi:MAG: acetyl-CoA carboxylase carboxyl transferase subunit beta, partial [Deinococcus sp.]|nr:acetyl-CoA carboxylase carboxyl transferase subunit beta [Deinococcus sp.]